MNVQGEGKLLREVAAGGQNFRRGGVDAVRVHGHTQALVIAIFFRQGASGVKRSLRPRKSRRRKGKNSLAAQTAQACRVGGLKDRLFKKIHGHCA